MLKYSWFTYSDAHELIRPCVVGKKRQKKKQKYDNNNSKKKSQFR